jgi:hypothetical protein
MPNELSIKKIEETSLFIQDQGYSLKNLVRIHIFNGGESVYANLLVSWKTNTFKTSLGVLKKGEGIYDVFIPDIREHIDVKFSICSSTGEVLDEKTLNWRPRRHWIIHLVQYSHHDLGYTDIPQNVLNEYVGFYDSIIQYCEETDNWPEDVKFRYQVEQLWSLLYYLRTQPKEKIEKLISLIRSGRLSVSALLGNEVSGLCRPRGDYKVDIPSI